MQTAGTDLQQLTERVRSQLPIINRLLAEVRKRVVGQQGLMSRLMIALLTGGHLLLEGVPGLAKTLTVRTLAEALNLDFRRLQFTPDLLPADLIGTLIFNQRTGEFRPHRGPIFANIILADEINRAPAKVQSALLEAMQERQVTIGDETYPLPEPFLVLATQNPIEQEGTYPLPEAQVDRFMFKVLVDYPSRREEREMLDRILEPGSRMVAEDATAAERIPVERVLAREELNELRATVNQIYLDERLKDYILDIVQATRTPAGGKFEQLRPLIRYGASPRATLYLSVAARAQAFLNGRAYVVPEDIRLLVYDVLRHRVILTYEAEAEELSPDAVIKRIVDCIPIP
jgi:MoxR-like ATPase